MLEQLDAHRKSNSTSKHNLWPKTAEMSSSCFYPYIMILSDLWSFVSCLVSHLFQPQNARGRICVKRRKCG